MAPKYACRFGNHYHVNRWGMRSPDMARSKSDNTEVRVLLFGDSVPFGGVQTDQDSLSPASSDRN